MDKENVEYMYIHIYYSTFYIYSTYILEYFTFYIYSRIYVCVYIYINTHNGLLLSHKKKERIPLVAVWMDLEISY